MTEPSARRTDRKQIIALALLLLGFPVILNIERATDYLLPIWAVNGVPAVVAARLLPTRAAALVVAAAVVFSWVGWIEAGEEPLAGAIGTAALLIIGVIGIQWASAERRLAVVGAERARLLEETQERAIEVEESRARLLEFFSLVAHDLQSPLATVSGYAQMLSQRNNLTSEQRQAMGISIRAAIQQVQRLATDMLDASRIGAGKFAVTRAPHDVVDICRLVVEQRQLTATDHIVSFAAPEMPLTVACDADRIAQAVGNLVDNAIKYSPPETEVRVEVRRSLDQARIAVIDQGIGIPSEEVGRLFQPYSRLRGSADRQGLGLGLYIVRGIAEAHGGSISVESAVGVGSVFTLTLPLGDEVPGRPEAAATP